MHSSRVSVTSKELAQWRESLSERLQAAHPIGHRHFHHHAHHHGLSRRQFLQVGVAALGTAAGIGLSHGTAFAAKPGTGIPSQVEGFSPILQSVFGEEIPFFLPPEVDPFGGADPVADSSTITDFNGFLGLIEADGVNDPSNSSDGEARRWACDVRFMKGVFRDRQGRAQRGAFGFF